jgi:hypothetical protein
MMKAGLPRTRNDVEWAYGNTKEVSAVKKSPKHAEERLSQAIRAWETCAAGQTFSDMTLEQLNEKAKAFRELSAKFEAAGTQWDTMRVELMAEAEKMLDLVKGLANSV